MRRKSSIRGEVELSFTKILFFIGLAVGGWAIYELSFAFYASVQIETAITEVILANRANFDEASVKEQIKQRAHAAGPVIIDEKTMTVLKNAETNMATVSMPYEYQIGIPFVSATWDVHFEPVIHESLKGSGL